MGVALVVSYWLRSKVMFSVHLAVKLFNYVVVRIANKTKRLSFKSGCDMLVAKLIKEDWPTLLR